MKQALATVVANDRIGDGVFVLRLQDETIAGAVRPGQFVHVRATTATDPLLRRPISVLRTGQSGVNVLPRSQFEILYDVVGRGTELLSFLRAGETVDVLGPLGRGFDLIKTTRHLLLVGGGVGIVPLVALAEEALRKEISVTLLAGFRNAGKVFPSELLPAEVEYVVTTNDGSVGRAGLVTNLMDEYLAWADQICACGPVPMLKAVAGTVDDHRRRNATRRSKGVPVQIAMEEHMGCAMGVCLGCVVPTRHGYQRVCRDGPVFDLNEMEWT